MLSFHQLNLEDEEVEEKGNSFNQPIMRRIPYRSKVLLLSGVFLLGIIGLGFIAIKGNNDERKKLSHNFSQNKSEQKEISIRSDLIIPAESTFLNRPDILVKINEAFKGQEGIKTVALVGIGGSGKTTLARQYAQQHKSNVTWEINAETKESLKRSFESLAENLPQTENDKKILKSLLEIKDPAEKETKIILFVRERLKFHPDWFLLYDNVEKFADNQEYFPHDSNVWGDGKVILTTRDRNIQNNKYISKIILIGELERDQKLSLFSKIMDNRSIVQTSYQKEEMVKFLEEIPSFPLDVSVAAFYIKATGIPFERYLKYLKENNREFEKINETILQEASDYTKTRFNIISLSLKQLIERNKDFRDLLLFISLLDSQEIPREVLETYKSEIVVDNFIYHLNKYSLVIPKKSSSFNSASTFSIHRSTQAIIFDYFVKTFHLESNSQLLQPIVHALDTYIETLIDNEDLAKMKHFISHCDMFLTHKNLLTVTMLAPIEGELGAIHYYIGNYGKSKYFLEKSFSILNAYNKHDPVRVAWILGYLGNIYRDLGDYEKGRNFMEESAQLYKKHLPKNHPRIAWILVYLGISERYLGNYEKAKKSFEQALSIYEKHVPEYYAGVAWALGQLGIIDREEGFYEKAQTKLEESLKIIKKCQPNDHIDIAWAFEHLGVVYKELGDYEKAKKSFEKAIEIYKKYTSEDDIYIAWNMAHLGDTFTRLKDYKKAKELLEKSYVIGQKHFGKNHIEISRVLMKLGKIYLAEGDAKTTENFLRNALSVLEKNKHPDIYLVHEGLAELYLKQSKDAAIKEDIFSSENFKKGAIEHLNSALEIVQIHFPKDSPHIRRMQSKLDALKNTKHLQN